MKRCTPLASLILAMLLAGSATHAGPPYATDDPEPVEFRHWEIYVASQFATARSGTGGTAPHFELNYGAHEDVQLHAIVPMAWSSGDQQTVHYGLGDIEFGMKLRFLHETRRVPQVGTFVIVDLASGDAQRGLGAGHAQVFVPLWIQKSWGAWTSYAGGGMTIHPGAPELDHWYFGCLLQRRLSRWITVGGETFVTTPSTDQRTQVGANVGAVVDVTDEHHILVSAGARYDAQLWPQGYLGYQLTLPRHRPP